jgi:hypothetical protein
MANLQMPRGAAWKRFPAQLRSCPQAFALLASLRSLMETHRNHPRPTASHVSRDTESWKTVTQFPEISDLGNYGKESKRRLTP